MPPVERIITHHSCTTVRRPAADVSRYVLDPTTMPHWSAVIYDVDPPTAGVFEQGGRLRGRMHILGLSLAVEGEMVEFDPAGMRAAIAVRPAGVPAEEGGLLEHDGARRKHVLAAALMHDVGKKKDSGHPRRNRDRADIATLPLGMPGEQLIHG